MNVEAAYISAALVATGVFLTLALSGIAIRSSRMRGLPIWLGVLCGLPPFCLIAGPILAVAAARKPAVEVKAQGGAFFGAGAMRVFSPSGFAVGLVVVLLSVLGAWLFGREVLDLAGEPLQAPIVQSLIVGGLIAGFLAAMLSRRVAFLEALFVTAAVTVVPIVASGPVMELFTYGTAPAYFAVLLIAADLLLLLAFVLGGSAGYLLWGDGEPVASWSYESWIGRRFLMGKRGDSVVGMITVISVLAVGVGTCAMVVVMSVMNGFSTDLRAKIFGANAHLIVLKYGVDFTEYEKIAADTKQVKGIVGASPFVLNELMVSSDVNHTGAVLKGIDVDTIDEVSILRKNVEKGDLSWLKTPEKIPGTPPPSAPGPAGEKKSERESLDDAIAAAAAGVGTGAPKPGAALPGIAIGSEMSKNLKVFVGDVVNVVTPIGELGPTGPVPRARAFRVAAIFHSGMYEYDSKFIYISLPQAQDFFSLNGGVTGIEYKVEDIEKVQGVSRELLRKIGGYPYRTKDWMEMNRNLFSALKLEKIAMFIILTFIIIVASFLIAATLIVFVIEKSKEIAIMKTMGATDTSIMKVFITYGVIVGSVGTAFGVGAGLAVCLALKTFGFGLDPDVYYISDLPVHVDTVEVAVVALAAVFLSYLATIYPALLAARLRPVEGLRYE